MYDPPIDAGASGSASQTIRDDGDDLFATVIEQRFMPKNTYHYYYCQIANIRMRRDESVYVFHDRIRALLMDIEDIIKTDYEGDSQLMMAPVRTTALDSFIYGLPDDIARVVEAQDPKTLENAVEIAVRVESRHRRRLLWHDSRHPSYDLGYRREHSDRDYRPRYEGLSPERNYGRPYPRFDSYSPVRHEPHSPRQGSYSPTRQQPSREFNRATSPDRAFNTESRDAPAQQTHHCKSCRCARASYARTNVHSRSSSPETVSTETLRSRSDHRPCSPSLGEPVAGPSTASRRSPSPNARDPLNTTTSRRLLERHLNQKVQFKTRSYD
ncbi:uncharacterized protein LOC114881125 [Osmia bicornis bicornis]|uniref:uncharacterized protein LOC114881125 n=1 Tax=Osmia bicornis bicornis TaxID=1437191 RepID=UPI001EAF1DE9|nr:uncharacterized protein LOC114881125 [Osmia bicornis bicornis]XP_029053621.2 uncharacterized protein LOC114881125 [Osmia bicornis bicornis]